MAVATARVGPQTPAIKCRICGRPSIRGAKLCDECVAAVKRARHVNTLTSEFLPQGSPGRPPLRVARPSLRARSTWLPTKPAGWGVLIAFTVFGAAVVGTAFLAVQEISEHSLKAQIAPSAIESSGGHASTPPQPPDVPARASSTTVPDNVPVERASQSPAPADAPRTEVSPAIVESPPPLRAAETRPPRKAATESRRKPSQKATPPAAESGERKAAIAAPEPTEAVSPPAPAPAPQPPVPDRWETMNAALAACSREGVLASVMCTERVRYQYCEGFWGQVPQCRAASPPGSSR